MAVRYWYLCRLQVYVSVNFAPLALQAGPGHLGNGLGHRWPAEPGCDEAAVRLHSRVVYRVQRLENHFPVLDRYQRAEHPRVVAWLLTCFHLSTISSFIHLLLHPHSMGPETSRVGFLCIKPLMHL
jgi:hypothetical protein